MQRGCTVGLANGWAVGEDADADADADAASALTTDSQRPCRAEATSSTRKTEKDLLAVLHGDTITGDYESQMARLAEQPLVERTSAH
jgi:hypothetical protein